MKKLESLLIEQIGKLKEEILNITNQIETFRNEGDEGDVGINIELQDKLELLTDKTFALQKNLSIYQAGQMTSKAAVGKTITISNERVTSKEVTLVLPEDANSQNGLVSCDSPLGSALIESGEGETINFETPVGIQEFVINRIL